MASSVRIDGSTELSVFGSNKSLIVSGGWGVLYDWATDSIAAVDALRRLGTLGFPPPFDFSIDGALPGRAAFNDFLYLFKDGRYQRLRRNTMTVDSAAKAAASAWDLPPTWTSFDSVLPGHGTKINFAYFFRGSEYIRYDWTTDRRSPNYPKQIGPEWHMSGPFVRDIDGVIIGEAGFTTKAYLFKTIPSVVNADGQPVAAGTPGSRSVNAPAYSRYDFSAEASEGAETNPASVVTNWGGVFPLLDAAAAADLAANWCAAAIRALGAPITPAVQAALQHHFRTPTPNPGQLAAIATRFGQILKRMEQIPDRFRFAPGLGVSAQTVPETFTEVGSMFSLTLGPNGRAATMIHEAVHFTFLAGGISIDIPEWSGETVDGVTFGLDASSGRAYASLSIDEAIANPSSYAAFAQEIVFSADTRFGAARLHQ